MSISSYKEINTHEDVDGNITKDTIERTNIIEKCGEPDYIKIYTKMWCEFNQIPECWRMLFLQLVMRMSYANTANTDEYGGQIVFTHSPASDNIMHELGWKTAMYYRGMQALCECGAIRKIKRGVYQINPSYAGRGYWKYNPKLQSGGIEDIIAQFNFKSKDIDVKIIWADDGENTPINNIYRKGMGVSPKDNTVIKTEKYHNNKKHNKKGHYNNVKSTERTKTGTD